MSRLKQEVPLRYAVAAVATAVAAAAKAMVALVGAVVTSKHAILEKLKLRVT